MSERDNCNQCGAEYEVVYEPQTPDPGEAVTCEQCGATLQPKENAGKPQYRLVNPGGDKG